MTLIRSPNVKDEKCITSSRQCTWRLAGCLFHDAFSVNRLYSVGDRVTSGWWIRKDLVVSGGGLILRCQPGILLERLRETMKIPNQDIQTPGLRFKPWTSRIQSRSINYSTMTLGDTLEGKCHLEDTGVGVNIRLQGGGLWTRQGISSFQNSAPWTYSS
jgi:hypothetical protein